MANGNFNQESSELDWFSRFVVNNPGLISTLVLALYGSGIIMFVLDNVSPNGQRYKLWTVIFLLLGTFIIAACTFATAKLFKVVMKKHIEIMRECDC
ncbi:hypothetical protein [Pseudomonas putida]|uniref:Transmembrane protein n=1 Tax=Pseudomonas putida TaxID=303 RepID=A0A8I1EFP5_PSEPU|nr:hypothetical protein [Pseudomonas putida]MBI6885825.1 hypothetical protein [Pseudomonas putida]